jgi:hypothetical protein
VQLLPMNRCYYTYVKVEYKIGLLNLPFLLKIKKMKDNIQKDGVPLLLLGKTSLTPLMFGHFYRYLPMFKTFHLVVSNFGFLFLCPFHTRNLNRMSILPQNYTSFWERCSCGFRGKIGIAKDFLYERDKVR